jgi:hypothetical protein
MNSRRVTNASADIGGDEGHPKALAVSLTAMHWPRAALKMMRWRFLFMRSPGQNEALKLPSRW